MTTLANISPPRPSINVGLYYCMRRSNWKFPHHGSPTQNARTISSSVYGRLTDYSLFFDQRTPLDLRHPAVA